MSAKTVLHKVTGDLLLRFTPRKRIHDMNVHAAVLDLARRSHSFSRVEAAMDLIGAHDPKMLRRIQKDILAIVVWPAGSFSAALNSTTRICLLNSSVLATDRSGLATALLLTHEGTHARLLQLGFSENSYPSARFERVCKRAELHLLLRIPAFTNRDNIIAMARRDLATQVVR
jgi:hypothetical protein